MMASTRHQVAGELFHGMAPRQGLSICICADRVDIEQGSF